MSGRIRKPHQPSFDYHVLLKQGETVEYERRPSDSPGWIWCIPFNKKPCWVPETWLQIQGNHGVVLKYYDSRELNVMQGEEVEIEIQESGWAWVTNSKKERGWIPADCIDM
jgi:hypothetical protein